MIVDIIFSIIGLAALVGIWYIVRRKMDKLRHLDVKSFKKERESATKNEIITRRLERKFTSGGAEVLKVLSPFGRAIMTGIRRLYRKIVVLERKYKQANETPKSSDTPVESSTLKLSTEIDALLEKKEYAVAEKKIIEMISHAPKDPNWYRCLGEIYMLTRQYDQAKETYEYVISLDDKLESESEIINGTANVEKASDCINLALVLRELGDFEQALEKTEKACRLESNNPRNLDLLFEISILAGNKVLAWEAHDRLKQVNPENNKIQEMEAKLKELEIGHPTIRPANAQK
ncbi:MAG: tetratricopeptide repeat protein [Patescibacteria group bacterium]